MTDADTLGLKRLHQQLDQVEHLMIDADEQTRLARVSEAVYGGKIPEDWLEKVVPAQVTCFEPKVMDAEVLTQAPENREAWVQWVQGPYRRPASRDVLQAMKNGIQAQKKVDRGNFYRCISGSGLAIAGAIWMMTMMSNGLSGLLESVGFLILVGLSVGFSVFSSTLSPFSGEAALEDGPLQALDVVEITACPWKNWRMGRDLGALAVTWHRSDMGLLRGDAARLTATAEQRRRAAHQKSVIEKPLTTAEAWRELEHRAQAKLAPKVMGGYAFTFNDL